MTHFRLRTQHDQDAGHLPTILLDWFGRGATIQVRQSLTIGLNPPSSALDLFRFAGAVFCADKLSTRPATWTRSLALDVPVRDLDAWSAIAERLSATLSFLSGDDWHLYPYANSSQSYSSSEPHANPVDAICLFSGGLDSFTGAVDLLTEGKKICLIAHHEGGQASLAQRRLARQLAVRYGRDRVVFRSLFLRPAPRSPLQTRALPGTREPSKRTRSLLFLAAGLAAAAGYGPRVPLFIPENGFIGINVPLTGARKGSLSTRTTHPYFMAELAQCTSALGVSNPINNPYRTMTKGEMLTACHDQKTMQQLSRDTLSCAHPEASRFAQRSQGNCGYCFPCLIRRAALHHVGLDAPSDYAYDALNEEPAMQGDRGADLRALIRSLNNRVHRVDVLRNGPVAPALISDFTGVFERGRAEILSWLYEATTSSTLKHQLPQ